MEETLYDHDKMIVMAREVLSSNIVEINTFEQLRELDSNSNHLQSDVLQIAADALHTEPEQIINITVLKKGMTNVLSYLSVVVPDTLCAFQVKEPIN